MVKRKVVILGGGAIGSVLAAALSSDPDLETILIGRPGHIARIREEGLLLEKENAGVFHFTAVEKIDFSLAGTLLIVTVKTYDLAAALSQAAPYLATDTRILLLQNGLRLKELAGPALVGSAARPEHLHRGIASMGAIFAADGRIRFFGGSIRVEPSFADSGWLAAFRHSFVKIEVSKDFQKDVWTKLLVNAVVNPLSLLLRGRNRVVADARFDVLKTAIADEVMAVAAAEGVTLDRDIAFINRFVSSDNLTSMLQDFLKKKQTEIDAINGAIVAAGKKHHLATPVNAFLVELVKAAAIVNQENAVSLTKPG